MSLVSQEKPFKSKVKSVLVRHAHPMIDLIGAKTKKWRMSFGVGLGW